MGLIAHYLLHSTAPEALAQAIAVEQTIESPPECAPQWIQDEIVGQVGSIDQIAPDTFRVTISYDSRIVGDGFPQLINAIWGNVSMLEGVRLVDVELSDDLLALTPGPRFGIEGLRERYDAPNRALAGTALKPLGSDSQYFAKLAATCARAGFDIIKDDHSLANQVFAPFEERVRVIAEAVGEVSQETGKRSDYYAALNVKADEAVDAARYAKSVGAGGLLILPGISGFDTLRAIADDDSIDLPIMGHPALLGSLLRRGDYGIDAALVFGLLMRMAGADASIFGHYESRFPFSPDDCREITDRAQQPLGALKPAWVSPAGGVTLDNLAEVLDFYGPHTATMVAGALLRGNVAENATRMVDIIHAAAP